MAAVVDLRLRTEASALDVASREGKLMAPSDWALLVTGPARVLKPNGQPLLVYLPGALPADVAEAAWPALRSAAMRVSDNRGTAAGTTSTKVVGAGTGQTRAARVRSSLAGAMEATRGRHPFCRLTSYSRHHVAGWASMVPLLQAMAQGFARGLPERYAAQLAHGTANPDAAEWLVPGTPYTTVTLNHTWATAGHYDKGDLDAGFSCLAVLRRDGPLGPYTGGQLVLPRYRVAVDMRDRDLLLMDAHELHGNVPMRATCPGCGPDAPLGGVRGGPSCARCGTDTGCARLAIVAYYRTEVALCGTRAAEAEREASFAQAKYDRHLARA